MRILIIQCGDYREAYLRLSSGGEETYYAQRFSIDYVSKLASINEYVGVLFIRGSEEYHEILSNGVHAIGFKYSKYLDVKNLIKVVSEQAPTHIILQTPITGLINWSCKASIKILPLLADSFDSNGIKKWIFNYRLRRALNRRCITWVANHNIGASSSLIRIGVDQKKVLPWDWPAQMSPASFENRTFKQKYVDSVSLIYIGFVSADKGLGDCINAVKYIKNKSVDVRLDIYGDGEIEKYSQVIINNNLEKEIRIHGKVSHREVISEILNHDMIIVPSHHSYPEGLPNVITEGLCTKTPLVISDHPMFTSRLSHEKSAMIFKAGDEIDMAKKILDLMNNVDLYNSLSQTSEEIWNKLQIQLKWNDLIDSWLDDTTETNSYLIKNSYYIKYNKDYNFTPF